MLQSKDCKRGQGPWIEMSFIDDRLANIDDDLETSFPFTSPSSAT
jgi:hypothetical protein